MGKASRRKREPVAERRPEKLRLFVGVPSIDGKVSAELSIYLSALQLSAAARPDLLEVRTTILTGVAPVHYARNVLSGAALATEADVVAMIDADMLPEDSVARLYGLVQSGAAALACPRMYRFRHSGPLGLEAKDPEIALCATTVNEETGERRDIIPTRAAGTPHRIDACGTGFLAISRKVLEDPRMRVGPSESLEVRGEKFDVPALFTMRQTATGRIDEWEDVDFSLRATRLGYPVVVDLGARCGHRKSINLDAVMDLIYDAHDWESARSFREVLASAERNSIEPAAAGVEVAAGV